MTTRRYLPSILLFLSVLTFALVSSCGPAEEDEPEPTDNTPVVTGFATDEIDHTHVKGTDPCPQPFTYPIQIKCFKDELFTTCDADSVVVTKTTLGIDVAFINGLRTVRLPNDGGIREADLEFTCAIEDSFVHTFTLVFFKAGVEVGREDVIINVTVK
jgi:hypothetical protein